MGTLLNVTWLVLCGFFIAIGYVIAGMSRIAAGLLIVTIPFGIASFRIASYALRPFGHTIIDRPSSGSVTVVGNIMWFLLFGWTGARGHGNTVGMQGHRPPAGLGQLQDHSDLDCPPSKQIVSTHPHPLVRLGTHTPV